MVCLLLTAVRTLQPWSPPQPLHSLTLEEVNLELARFKGQRGVAPEASPSENVFNPFGKAASSLSAALAFSMMQSGQGGEEWARVAGRMQAKRLAKERGTRPAALTEWHDPGALLFPLLSTHPFHEPDDPWWCDRVSEAVALLEHFYPVIRDEALSLRQGASGASLPLYRDHGDALLHENGQWKVHYVELEGKDTSAAREKTPKIAAIVDAIARRSSHSFLSVLEPGTHILPHCGPSNYRLRLQLGLSVPGEKCRIRVGDQTRAWVSGKCLVIDDAFEHEVWNDTDEERIILIVDIWHPDFSDAEVRWMEETRAAKFRKRG